MVLINKIFSEIFRYTCSYTANRLCACTCTCGKVSNHTIRAIAKSPFSRQISVERFSRRRVATVAVRETTKCPRPHVRASPTRIMIYKWRGAPYILVTVLDNGTSGSRHTDNRLNCPRVRHLNLSPGPGDFSKITFAHNPFAFFSSSWDLYYNNRTQQTGWRRRLRGVIIICISQTQYIQQ